MRQVYTRIARAGELTADFLQSPDEHDEENKPCIFRTITPAYVPFFVGAARRLGS